MIKPQLYRYLRLPHT